MTIFAKLGLGFGTVVATFVLAAALILWNLTLLRTTDEHVRDRVSFNEIALEYRHAAQDAALGASQFASGNSLGEQRIREGTHGMQKSRNELKSRLKTAEEKLEFQELERVEKLTIAATEHVVTLVRAKSPPLLIQQELMFLSARADALNIRLEALFDETHEEVVSSIAFSDTIGRRVQKQTSYALLACVAFAILISSAVFRSIARPLAQLADGVKRIGEGHLDHVIAVTSRDEFGKLTTAFNEMTRGLKGAMSALDSRNRDMRVVLDHVNQGLLTMNRDGTVSKERSARVDSWLGVLDPERTLWSQLAALDARFAASLELGWEEVLADILPIELTLSQMPRNCILDGRHLEFDYRPIFEEGTLSKLLVVVSDVSDRIAREQERAREQEVMAIFQAIQRDKQGFLDFFAEGTELVSALAKVDASTDLAVLKRQIHTIKGNSSIFGISSVASSCHELETQIEESESVPSHEQIADLERQWEALGKMVSKLVGDSSLRIEIDDDEFSAILHAVVRGTPRRELARMVANWRMERVEYRLSRFADQARALAERLQKAPLEVRIESHGVRLPRDTFASFWNAFVHAIRNALDHGIETPSERAERGKPDGAVLSLATRVSLEELSIEVADNGRGINWEKIADKARQKGLAANTEDDLVQALFSDGVSTAEGLSDVSGRGVGMAALRDACAKLAGRIVIQSAPGEGTRMSFRFPLRVTFDETIVEISALPIKNSLPPSSPTRRISVGPPNH